ncbi:O-antigen ligase family protein [Candidatus Uhrbacteria bacterium]|nr:O-antigen ligase family protein [Candidatus Uhrbacteria bacterium]
MKRFIRLALGIIFAAAVAALVHPLLSLSIVFLAAAVWFLARNLLFGLLVLVFFFPYLGLVIDFSAFEIFKDVPYLKSINAPFVDLYGLLLFAAWGINIAGNWKLEIRNWRLARPLPHWRSYLLFWLSGLLSLLKVPAIQFNASFKYFARPFTFFYLVFFIVPVSIIARHKDKIDRVLLVFFATGLIAALDGLLGLVLGAHGDFPRARPFGAFGLNPLGANHNLLAETLVATAPVGLLLMQNAKLKIKTGELQSKNFTFYILHFTFLQWAVALLTFSRSAWIAVLIQAMCYLAVMHRGRVRAFLKEATPALILFAAMTLTLAATTFTEAVRGSTLSRLDQARIATFYFSRSPILGQGIGTFIPTLWQTKAFLLEYGEPLDAHGIIFKLMFEQGLLGLAGFIILIGSILYYIAKPLWSKSAMLNAETRMATGVALLIALGAISYQLFNTTYYTSKLWVPLAIAVAIGQLGKSSKSGESSKAGT